MSIEEIITKTVDKAVKTAVAAEFARLRKRLNIVAEEMCYSFIHIRRMHGWALKNFGKKFLKDDTQ